MNLQQTKIRFIIDGPDAAKAAAELQGLLKQELGLQVQPQTAAEIPGPEREKIDPIALAALILAIPGTILAAVDLADRISKRKQAKDLVEKARALAARHPQVTININLPGGITEPVAQVDSDKLLEHREQP